MIELIKLVIKLFVVATCIELISWFFFDIVKERHEMLMGSERRYQPFLFVREAFRNIPTHIKDTIIFDLIKSVPKIIGQAFKLTVRLILVIVDVFIAFIWSFIPILGRVVKSPKISKIIRI